MVDYRIRDLPEEETSPADGDYLVIDDVSGTELKKISRGNLLNVSDAEAEDLIDGGDSTLHYHASDRDLVNATGTVDDTRHGNRSGGALHAVVIAAGAAGFMTGSDKTKLDSVDANADVTGSNPPQAHKTSHQSGGGDAIKLDDLAAPDDNTDLDASTTKHGLLPKLGGGTTNYLRADGNWFAPTEVAFGSWTNLDSDSNPLVKDSVYLVTSDGFVTAYSTAMDAFETLSGYTDGSNPPTTLRLHEAADYGGGRSIHAFTMPVRNGDYFKVACSEIPTIHWLPFGSGECQKQT